MCLCAVFAKKVEEVWKIKLVSEKDISLPVCRSQILKMFFIFSPFSLPRSNILTMSRLTAFLKSAKGDLLRPYATSRVMGEIQ